MKKKIKMIGLDLDGTLLNEQKTITPHTREVLVAALDQGVTVLPATGRPLVGVPEELRRIPGIRYILTANGARVIDQLEDKIIFEHLIGIKDAERVLDIFDEYDTLIEAFHRGKGYMKQVDILEKYFDNNLMMKYTLETRKCVGNLKAAIRQLPGGFDKIRAVFYRPGERKEALQRIKTETGLEVTGALANDLEVNRAGVNKGAVLLDLGQMLGIREEEIMACGDGLNDLEMIRRVGFGVAMENGIAEIKKTADYITAANDNEGVAKAIKTFVLK